MALLGKVHKGFKVNLTLDKEFPGRLLVQRRRWKGLCPIAGKVSISWYCLAPTHPCIPFLHLGFFLPNENSLCTLFPSYGQNGEKHQSVNTVYLGGPLLV